MSKEFLHSKPNGDWSPHDDIGGTMEAARSQLRSGLFPYTLKVDDRVIGKGKRKKVLFLLRHQLEIVKVGPTARIWAGKKIRFRAKRTEPALHIIDTNGNDHADFAWSVIRDKFHDVRFLGAYVCKHIVGSYTMSQHSYGNAVDFGRDNMDELWDLAHYAVANADVLHIQHVIVGDRIWTRGSGWAHYSGEYHYHVHIDFAPQYSGSCGVRG